MKKVILIIFTFLLLSVLDANSGKVCQKKKAGIVGWIAQNPIKASCGAALFLYAAVNGGIYRFSLEKKLLDELILWWRPWSPGFGPARESDYPESPPVQSCAYPLPLT
jgi:hypothetical protein